MIIIILTIKRLIEWKSKSWTSWRLIIIILTIKRLNKKESSSWTGWRTHCSLSLSFWFATSQQVTFITFLHWSRFNKLPRIITSCTILNNWIVLTKRIIQIRMKSQVQHIHSYLSPSPLPCPKKVCIFSIDHTLDYILYLTLEGIWFGLVLPLESMHLQHWSHTWLSYFDYILPCP